MKSGETNNKVLNFFKNNIFVIFLLVLIVASVVLVPNFSDINNLKNILIQISLNGILATGMTYVIMTGGIDLSVGSLAALSGITITAIITNWPKDTPLIKIILLAIVICLVIGVVFGAFMGFEIADVMMPPFIATYVVELIARAFAYIYTHSQPIFDLPTSFNIIGVGYIAGKIPVLGALFVVIILIALFVEKKTVYGRNIFAVGSNKEVAKLSGINVRWVLYRVHIFSAILSCIVGVCLASRLGSGQPSAATGYETYAIAAVAMGGTSMSGGNGSILKTLTGILSIGIINNVLSLLRVDSYWQPVATGLIIFAAVAFDQMKNRKKA